MNNTTDTKTKNEDFKQLIEDKAYTTLPKAGEIIKGAVVGIKKNEVKIDINGTAIGVIRGRELHDESGQYTDLKLGDKVEATLLELENENGEMELSLRFAGHKKAWDKLNDLKDKQELVEALITDANRGGLMVKIGQISGFLPVSQLVPEHYPRVPGGDKNKILERLKEYVGQKFKIKIIAAEEADEKLIVSEKSAWEEHQKEIISKYKVSDIIEGKITAITDFGAFVNFSNNLEGLIHISELAWQRIDDPKKFVSVGQKIKAEIISIDGSKIFLSMKKLMDDPWKNVKDKYKIGQIVKGKILKINPFGLFVELDRDIHGLAHISELADKPVSDPRELVKIGDIAEFKVVSIEPEEHRLGLSKRSSKQTKPAVKEVKQEKAEEQKEREEPKERAEEQKEKSSKDQKKTEK